MIAIQNPLLDIRDAHSRQAFETWARAKGYNLSPLNVNGQFHHYMDPSTDDAWLGYCEAVRQARAVTYPIVTQLLYRQAGLVPPEKAT